MLTSHLLGEPYLTDDALGRAARRELYCSRQLLFYPNSAFDPRTELSFLSSLSAVGILEFGTTATQEITRG